MSTEQVRQLIAAIDAEAPPDTSVPRLFQVAALSPTGKVERWEMHRAHPLAPNDMTVVRMYKRANGIKIYSVTNDGKAGMLNFLPIDKVFMTAATMDQQVFLDQLDACEADEDEDSTEIEPESDDPEDVPETPGAPASNEQAVS